MTTVNAFTLSLIFFLKNVCFHFFFFFFFFCKIHTNSKSPYYFSKISAMDNLPLRDYVKHDLLFYFLSVNDMLVMI